LDGNSLPWPEAGLTIVIRTTRNAANFGYRELVWESILTALEVAGLIGLGGPEVAALLVLGIVAAVVVLIMKVIRKPAAPSRYCPKCGRGLTQPPDALFCGFCGNRLP
jgi:hypothetical protein